MNDMKKTPEKEVREVQTTRQKKDNAATRYVPPQILSHSARDLEKQNLRVNACTSFFP